MARSGRWLCCLPIGVCLVAPSATGQEPNSLGDSQADLVYTPVAPCRIIDTRIVGGPIAAGTTRNFLVTGTDYSTQGGKLTGCGVPYGPATAAVINFVAVNPAGQGNLQVTPFGSAMPLASIINYRPGVSIANGLVVALCDSFYATCTNDVTIKANVSATDLVADVEGYFHRTPALFVNTALSNTALGDGALASATTGSNNTATGTNSLGANTTGQGNSAFGQAALASNSTASGNSAFGAAALFNNTTGALNSAFGNAALQANTTGALNSAFGNRALLANTTGGVNSAFGVDVLSANTTGALNSAFGAYALSSNTTGAENSGFGYHALYSNTTGEENSALGLSALHDNTTGGFNSAFGYTALFHNETGAGNSALGTAALYHNTTGSYSSAFGLFAMQFNLTGWHNSAFGVEALRYNTTGAENSAFGDQALHQNTTAVQNSGFGAQALQSNTLGQNNSALGFASLIANTTGSGNVAIGYRAGSNHTVGDDNIYIANTGGDESGTIRIGTSDTHTATYIAGIYGAAGGSTYVLINASTGQLTTSPSSRRYKDQIADMGAESDVLLKLRPVAFYYRPEMDATHTRQYGLVAEEVAEVAPELVLNDKNGAPDTVRYPFVNAMLLNEVQKQRRLIDEQNTTIQELEARLARLEAALTADR